MCAPPEQLTPTEQAVYELKLEGLLTREIAARLYMAYDTAKLHEAHIREKLGGTGAGQGWWLLQAREQGRREAERNG